MGVTWLAGCAGKVRFDTFAAASQVNARRRRQGKPGAVYHCPHCRAWHIGGKK